MPLEGPPTLRGERIVLRSIEGGDAERLLAILQEPAVARWWPRYDARKVREDLLEDDETTVYVIELEGEVIGAIQYAEEPEPSYEHASIDVFLATARHGQGLGTEAVRLLARHLVTDRGHHRVTIDPTVGNHGAIRAYEKAGFRPVGVMREYVRAPTGGWEDGMLMDVLARELE